MQRRLVLAGAAGLFAPAVVPLGSLMALPPPVRLRWVRGLWVRGGAVVGAADFPCLPDDLLRIPPDRLRGIHLPIRSVPGLPLLRDAWRANYDGVIMAGLRRAGDGRLVLSDVDGFRAAMRAIEMEASHG